MGVKGASISLVAQHILAAEGLLTTVSTLADNPAETWNFLPPLDSEDVCQG